MGIIRDTNGANVSVAQINGYTKEGVIKAKRFLREIGSDRRNFPIDRLVEMYNELKGTSERSAGCRPCQATKFYNGIQNYAYFGELTLVNNNRCTREELDIDIIDSKQEETAVEKTDIKERMAALRAAKAAKKARKEEGEEK